MSTTAVLQRDWIDELVDWQLKNHIGLCTSEMFEVRDAGYCQWTEDEYQSGATWSPEHGWREVDCYGNPWPLYEEDYYDRPLQVIPIRELAGR